MQAQGQQAALVLLADYYLSLVAREVEEMSSYLLVAAVWAVAQECLIQQQ
jgi:hypothetical protein